MPLELTKPGGATTLRPSSDILIPEFVSAAKWYTLCKTNINIHPKFNLNPSNFMSSFAGHSVIARQWNSMHNYVLLYMINGTEYTEPGRAMPFAQCKLGYQLDRFQPYVG